jgi:hypothetical protein
MPVPSNIGQHTPKESTTHAQALLVFIVIIIINACWASKLLALMRFSARPTHLPCTASSHKH